MSILATHGSVISALVAVMVAPWAIWLLCEMAGYQAAASGPGSPGAMPQVEQAAGAVIATAGDTLDVLAQVEQLLETMELGL